MKILKRIPKSNCETCVYYGYDDRARCYECQTSLDEDEMAKFLSRSAADCPYYKFHDDFNIQRKEI